MNLPDEVTKLLEEIADDPSFSRYQAVGRVLARMDPAVLSAPEERRVRLGLLSSFTIDPLIAFLQVGCLQEGLLPELYLEGFNQYRQALLDPESDFYGFAPDLAFLMVELDSLLPGMGFKPVAPADIDAVLSQLASMSEAFKQHASGVLVMGNFMGPHQFPFSLHPGEVEKGYWQLNRALEEHYEKDARVFVADLDHLAAHHGRERVGNPKLRFLARMSWSETFVPEVAHLCLGFVWGVKNRIRKCLVLDLDNTLWGGIIGEDGLDGIELGPEGIGRAYGEFQQVILALYEKGVILAINSKNNYEDAIEVIRQHPHMVLREEHFGSFQINWEDKVTNMYRIADELNIGLDSLVFMDDSPQERLLIRRALPQILTVEMPDDPSFYPAVVARLNCFDQLYSTEEDRQRGAMYAAQRSRRELQTSSADLDQYLDSLDMKLVIRQAEDANLDRVHQLIQRTNQFNLTTIRHGRAEVEQMMDSSDFRIYAMWVSDIFGDLGLTGVVVVRMREREWDLDTFLMSCRVMGRSIETEFLNQVLLDARDAGVALIRGRYIPTPRNKPAAEVYAKYGFRQVQSRDDTTLWELPLPGFEVVPLSRFEVHR